MGAALIRVDGQTDGCDKADRRFCNHTNVPKKSLRFEFLKTVKMGCDTLTYGK